MIYLLPSCCCHETKTTKNTASQHRSGGSSTDNHDILGPRSRRGQRGSPGHQHVEGDSHAAHLEALQPVDNSAHICRPQARCLQHDLPPYHRRQATQRLLAARASVPRHRYRTQAGPHSGVHAPQATTTGAARGTGAPRGSGHAARRGARQAQGSPVLVSLTGLRREHVAGCHARSAAMRVGRGVLQRAQRVP